MVEDFVVYGELVIEFYNFVLSNVYMIFWVRVFFLGFGCECISSGLKYFLVVKEKGE